jgi:DNA-binding NarL/FixJ family response regulator
MRIIVAEDSVLFREGLVRLLTEAGHEVVATADNADSLVAGVDGQQADLLIVDVRMPPGMKDDGALAAQQLRMRYPHLAIVLLSQHVETRHVLRLVATGSFGYLLKDRVLRVDDFLDALTRVAGGGTALDPAIVQALVVPARSDDPIRDLSAREREVLELAAEGKSNTSVSRQLVISERTVETHMRAIFRKLNIDEDEGSHRRVLAVLAHLTHHDRIASP